jgi:hypothetical protein
LTTGGLIRVRLCFSREGVLHRIEHCLWMARRY